MPSSLPALLLRVSGRRLVGARDGYPAAACRLHPACAALPPSWGEANDDGKCHLT